MKLIIKPLFAAGLLLCTVVLVGAQVVDDQVRLARESSQRAERSRPAPGPTSLVLLNGVLVETAIASGGGSATAHLNVPLSTLPGETGGVVNNNTADPKIGRLSPAGIASSTDDPQNAGGERATPVGPRPAGPVSRDSPRAAPVGPQSTDSSGQDEPRKDAKAPKPGAPVGRQSTDTSPPDEPGKP